MKLRRFQLVRIAIFILVGFVCRLYCFAQDSSVEKSKFDSLMSLYTQEQHTPSEILPLLRAEEKKSFKEVIRLADEIIARPETSFESINDSHFVKSLAYMHRGQARYQLTYNTANLLDDFIKAADLGNVQAINLVSKKLLDIYTGRSLPIRGYNVSAKDVEKYLRKGAELGDSEASANLGLEDIDGMLTDEERHFWLLLGLMEDRRSPKRAKDTMLAGVIDQFGETETLKALEKYSLIGGVLQDSQDLPGRDITATLFSEMNLRGGSGRALGTKMPPLTTTVRSVSTLDHFFFIRTLVRDLGYATAYLLVPGDRRFDDRHMISVSYKRVEEILGPGDQIIVRCGALTHVVTVYKVDRATNKLYSVDPLFQFWQPSHNSCVKSLEFVKSDTIPALIAVPFQDTIKMIQAVITLRTKDPNVHGTKK